MAPDPRKPGLAGLAAGQIDAEDDRILAQLAALYHDIDPPPAGMVERIQFGITLDALHAEIAELQRNAERAGVRSGEAIEAQSVTFTSASMTTMVTITASSGDRVRIDGWVAPGGGVTVELRIAGESRTTMADADGRFVFADVPRGMAQFLLRPPAGTSQTPVVTPSIEI
jgi:hypothetical protein